MPKHTLRQLIRARLDAVPPAERAARSLALCMQIAAMPEWRGARTVGLFAPLPSEPDLDLLWAIREERRFVFPLSGPEGGMTFHFVDRLESLQPVRGKLREPVKGGEAVPPEMIDLLFVPGMAFTRGGHRLGRGGGYYDRFLADPRLQARLVGICFAEQVVEELPLHPHDRSVHRLLVV